MPATDAWGYRWNPEVMAAAGYVVILPNPHGSPGYGSKFTDEISKDWGGKVYTDVMAGVDAASECQDLANRIEDLGSSFGRGLDDGAIRKGIRKRHAEFQKFNTLGYESVHEPFSRFD